MNASQLYSRTTEWSPRPQLAAPDFRDPSTSTKNAKLVTAERDGYEKMGAVAVERGGNGSQLREVFDDFVGQTFYNQMLSAMRKTVDKPAYFHGGQAEEVFQAQLDQTLAERLADVTAEQFSGPMFELFNLQRQ